MKLRPRQREVGGGIIVDDIFNLLPCESEFLFAQLTLDLLDHLGTPVT